MPVIFETGRYLKGLEFGLLNKAPLHWSEAGIYLNISKLLLIE